MAAQLLLDAGDFIIAKLNDESSERIPPVSGSTSPASMLVFSFAPNRARSTDVLSGGAMNLALVKQTELGVKFVSLYAAEMALVSVAINGCEGARKIPQAVVSAKMNGFEKFFICGKLSQPDAMLIK